MAHATRTTDNARRKEFNKMINRFSLTTPLNPFVLRILKTCEARTLLLEIVTFTLLLAIGTFATLLCSGCTNGGYISTSGRQQNTFGLGGVPPDSAFVDWTKPASAQTGTDHPQYDGIGTP
jgi:hypothetical protein